MKNKNLWLLPIDKASRLVIYENNDFILLNRYEPNWIETNFNRTNQHIYITSDREIKEGDWVLNISNNKIFKQDNSKYDGYTLSFYKKIILTTDQDLIKDGIQAIDDEFLEWFVKNPSCEEVEVEKWFDKNSDEEYFIPIISKEETLEEVAENYVNSFEFGIAHPRRVAKNAFINGAKWQQEKTIEEVFEWLTTNNYLTDLKETLIENFKNR